MRLETSNFFVRSRSVWVAFIGCSLTATLIGCWVASVHGTASRAWLLNLAAWAVGAALAAALARRALKIERWWPAIALAALSLTFLSAGLSGVHRWISLGPVRLNSAELVLPSLIVALAAWRGPYIVKVLVFVAAMAGLALQPDASQATAFAGGSIVVIVLVHRSARRWIVPALLLAVIAVVVGLRPDPLSPVPEVEGIIGLAAAISPAIAGLAILALAGVVLTPLLVANLQADDQPMPLRAAACGLTAYLALSALAPAFGAFPVPLVGMGVSPILGIWLGVGGLMGLRRSDGRPDQGGAS